MCAEAYMGEEPLRHINSAFMTFEVLDDKSRPRPLPRIRPEPLVRPRSKPTSCSDFLCSLCASFLQIEIFLFINNRMGKGDTKKRLPERRSDLTGTELQCLSVQIKVTAATPKSYKTHITVL